MRNPVPVIESANENKFRYFVSLLALQNQIVFTCCRVLHAAFDGKVIANIPNKNLAFGPFKFNFFAKKSFIIYYSA